MNAIARRGLCVPTPEPALSDALDRAVDRVLNPVPGVGRERHPQAVCVEARQRLAAYEALCRPVESETVRGWLWPIAAGVRNPPDAGAFAMRVTAIAMACADMPEAVFTPETQHKALAAFPFLPAAADVVGLLKPRAARLTRIRWALREIASSIPLSPPLPRPDAAERDRILEAFRAQYRAAVAPARSRAEQMEAVAPRAPRPAYLTPEQLAVARRR